MLMHRVESFEGIVTIVTNTVVVIVHPIVLTLMSATIDTAIKVFVAVVDLHVMMELSSMEIDRCQTVSSMITPESQTMVMFASPVIHAEIVQAEHIARRIELEAAFDSINAVGKMLLRQIGNRLIIMDLVFVQFDFRDLNILFIFRRSTSFTLTIDVICVGFLLVDIKLINIRLVVAFVGDDCD